MVGRDVRVDGANFSVVCVALGVHIREGVIARSVSEVPAGGL